MKFFFIILFFYLSPPFTTAQQNPYWQEPSRLQADSLRIVFNNTPDDIPRQVLDKIFQPFFTTKPTGQGTGLGLSLSYDIIMAHGGEISVETGEGEFTEFLIRINV